MCASIYISACVLKLCVRALGCVCERVFCAYPWKLLLWEEGERRSVEDGNKIKLFIGLEWERVAWATLCPLPIYFSVGVWECWTRLNRLALTKQHKINTGDRGYNNTRQPLLLSAYLLSDTPSGPHIKNRKQRDGSRKNVFFFYTESWSFCQTSKTLRLSKERNKEWEGTCIFPNNHLTEHLL